MLCKKTWRWIWFTSLVALVAIMINLFLFRIAIVSGYSMYPTLFDGDIMIVNLFNRDFRTGDIVICNSSAGIIVKRIIATEGQCVIINYTESHLYVDNTLISESYLPSSDEKMISPDGEEIAKYIVPAGCYFVMGDNRNDSADSRFPNIGYISSEKIIGKLAITIPLGRSYF